jgi:hypothetical protein
MTLFLKRREKHSPCFIIHLVLYLDNELFSNCLIIGSYENWTEDIVRYLLRVTYWRINLHYSKWYYIESSS